MLDSLLNGEYSCILDFWLNKAAFLSIIFSDILQKGLQMEISLNSYNLLHLSSASV